MKKFWGNKLNLSRMLVHCCSKGVSHAEIYELSNELWDMLNELKVRQVYRLCEYSAKRTYIAHSFTSILKYIHTHTHIYIHIYINHVLSNIRIIVRVDILKVVTMKDSHFWDMIRLWAGGIFSETSVITRTTRHDHILADSILYIYYYL
jgi:hypothetical protein